MQKNYYLFRILFLIIAGLIILGTIVYYNHIFNQVDAEEHQKVALFAEALKSMDNPEKSHLDLYMKIIEQNHTVPILIFDQYGKLIQHKNINLSIEEQHATKSYLLDQLGTNTPPIIINISKGTFQYIYYSKSRMLRTIKYAPFIQLVLILILIASGYAVYLNIRRSEQNSIWAGLSKETAHQLGTPISSLAAWTEMLKSQEHAPDFINEIDKDIQRLIIISERFSSIGSVTSLTKQDLIPIIKDTISYMHTRTSHNIQIILEDSLKKCNIPINKELFVWVMENIIKNSIDAIVQKGKILIKVSQKEEFIIIDISDTGQGIMHMQYDKIFRPGYSTKKRGWGLGLSLVKRIVKNYHNGRIFVKKSEIGKGTTLRILLPKYQKPASNS